jgi:hypothetical protein
MQREIIGVNPYYCEGRTADPGEYRQGGKNGSKHITAPATDAARTWQHHGSALKPANEHWIIARKPLIGTIAENCLQTGAGALNIDSARIGSEPAFVDRPRGPKSELINQLDGHGTLSTGGNGRWPANFVLSHSADCEYVGVKRVKSGTAIEPNGKKLQRSVYGDTNTLGRECGYADADGYETVQEWRCSESCAVRLLGEQSGELKSGAKTRNKVDPIPTGGKYGIYGDWEALCDGASFQGDTGTAARFFFNADFSLDQQEAIDNAAPFFYAAKASRRERDNGLEDGEILPNAGKRTMSGGIDTRGRPETLVRNGHPTVKPLKLGIYLAKLLGIPDAYAPRRLLNPFGGSGSESIAAMLSGYWDEITYIERELEYVTIAQKRAAYWQAQQAKQQPTLLEMA